MAAQQSPEPEISMLLGFFFNRLTSAGYFLNPSFPSSVFPFEGHHFYLAAMAILDPTTSFICI